MQKIFIDVGKMYNKKLATVAWGFMFVGLNVLYLAMQIVGIQGMPRRYYDYLPEFTDLNRLATVGSWVLAIGLVMMFANLFYSIRRGSVVGSNPWGGVSLEWQIPSPPPTDNFGEHDPIVTHGPYDFKEAGIL